MLCEIIFRQVKQEPAENDVHFLPVFYFIGKSVL